MPRAKQKREYTIAKVRENVSNFSSLSSLLAPATNKAGKKPLKKTFYLLYALFLPKANNIPKLFVPLPLKNKVYE